MKSLTYFIVILVVAALGVFGYIFYSQESEKQAIATGVTTGTTAINFPKFFDRLSKFTWKEDIFKNPNFISLTDFSVTIQSQDLGRKNPFGSIGLESTFSFSPSSGQSTSTQSSLGVDN